MGEKVSYLIPENKRRNLTPRNLEAFYTPNLLSFLKKGLYKENLWKMCTRNFVVGNKGTAIMCCFFFLIIGGFSLKNL